MSSYTTRRSTGPSLRSISPSTRFNRHYSTSPPSFHSPSASSSRPNRSISVTNRSDQLSTGSPPRKRTCMCSPTDHPGSFRCRLHKIKHGSETVSCGSSSRLNMRRSAMKNSLVRIGTVEGDWMKRALAALIRPSSHKQHRRGEFRPSPSRLSVTAMA